MGDVGESTAIYSSASYLFEIYVESTDDDQQVAILTRQSFPDAASFLEYKADTSSLRQNGHRRNLGH
jgi:hypothetical protein